MVKPEGLVWFGSLVIEGWELCDVEDMALERGLRSFLVTDRWCLMGAEFEGGQVMVILKVMYTISRVLKGDLPPLFGLER